MKRIGVLLYLLLSINCFAGSTTHTEQELNKIAQEIQSEAMLLYRSESASWFGTDIFMANYKGERESIGGYFSYPEGQSTKCVFFSKDKEPQVLGTVVFDTVFSMIGGRLNESKRVFTGIEKQYYYLRAQTIALVQNDTNFRSYKNTNLNVVPLIEGGKKRVYVMTSTTDGSVVLYGNDYVIEYDDELKVLNQKALHSTLMPAEQPKEDQPIHGFIHTHIPEYSPFITPTDICTTKLFEKITGIGTCSVVSKQYISIWSGKSLKIIHMPDKKKD